MQVTACHTCEAPSPPCLRCLPTKTALAGPACHNSLCRHSLLRPAHLPFWPILTRLHCFNKCKCTRHLISHFFLYLWSHSSLFMILIFFLSGSFSSPSFHCCQQMHPSRWVGKTCVFVIFCVFLLIFSFWFCSFPSFQWCQQMHASPWVGKTSKNRIQATKSFLQTCLSSDTETSGKLLQTLSVAQQTTFKNCPYTVASNNAMWRSSRPKLQLVWPWMLAVLLSVKGGAGGHHGEV